jgi:hypothetical protein
MTTDARPDLEQLRDFRQWRAANGEDFGLLNYLYHVGNQELAIAFAALFWPDLVEHDGGVFLAAGFSAEVYAQWRVRLGDDPAAIERMMNHRHVGDLLPGADDVGGKNEWYLGQTIAQMWDCRLARRFPDRHFVVTCERDEDAVEVVVTFHQAGD